MGKQNKRARKFLAKGGVQGRLEKGGTIVKKGKMHHNTNNNKRKAAAGHDDDKEQGASRPKKTAVSGDNNNNNNNGDLLAAKNIANLDMDSFFSTVNLALEQEEQQQQQHHADSATDSEDDDAGDDASDSETEQAAPPPAKKKKTKTNKNNKGDDSDDGNSSSNDDDDGDDSGSDDEDVEAAERRMKKEMSNLTKSDPAFHKFLNENESSLLEFGQEEEDDDDGEEEEGDGKKKAKADNKDKDDDTIHLTPELLQTLEKGAFTAHGFKSLRKLVNAYRSACHLADVAGAAVADDDHGGAAGRAKSYHIDSSTVFDKLMVLVLERGHEEFRHHLQLLENSSSSSSKDNDGEDDDKDSSQGDENSCDVAAADASGDKKVELNDNKPIHPKTLENAPRWSDVQPVLRSFFRSTMHILSQGQGDIGGGGSKEPELLTFILKALSKYIPLLTPFPRLADAMLKTLNILWSGAPSLDSSQDYQVVRLHAFFRIRQLALTQPFPFIENILKKTYLAYTKRAKFATGTTAVAALTSSSHAGTASLPTLTFMGNCLVELYSLDYDSSYQHAFVYIRQLALQLRTYLQKKTTVAFQQVYCWQFVHSLHVWVAILAQAAQQQQQQGGGSTASSALMQSLVYPLTEIIIGTARFAPCPVRHLPLRLHCIRLLQQLAAATETFIPTTLLLLDCLDWKEWYLKPKKTGGSKKGKKNNKTGGGVAANSNTRGISMAMLLKLPKDDTLRTQEQLEPAMTEIFLLLEREVDLYRYSAGFPEFSIRIVQRLQAFVKQVRNQRWQRFAQACLEKCHAHAAGAITARSKLEVAPKDVSQLECIRPPDAPSMGQRHLAAVDKEQKLALAAMNMSSLSPATMDDGTTNNKKKNNKKNASDDMSVDSDDRDDDDDNSDSYDDMEDEEEEEDNQGEKESPTRDRAKKNKEEISKSVKAKINKKLRGDDHDDGDDDNTGNSDKKNALEQQDEVHEGINWSDDDDDHDE